MQKLTERPIQTPLDLIHYLTQGENFDVVKPAVRWSAFEPAIWSRAIAAAIQVFDSMAANTSASIQLRRAEQFVWRTKLQQSANVVHLNVGLVVDAVAVVDAVHAVCGKAEISIRYDGAMNVLVELPKSFDRRAATGDIIASLKAAGVEAYCG